MRPSATTIQIAAKSDVSTSPRPAEDDADQNSYFLPLFNDWLQVVLPTPLLRLGGGRGFHLLPELQFYLHATTSLQNSL